MIFICETQRNWRTNISAKCVLFISVGDFDSYLCPVHIYSPLSITNNSNEILVHAFSEKSTFWDVSCKDENEKIVTHFTLRRPFGKVTLRRQICHSQHKSEIYPGNSQKLLNFIAIFTQKIRFMVLQRLWVSAHAIDAWLIDDWSHLFNTISYK